MTMSVSAISRPLRYWSFSLQKVMARPGDFIALMKPRVMSLVVFTAMVGEWLAPGHITLASSLGSIIGIALGTGAAGVLNMWYDADIDSVMRRTASRPIPSGRVTRAEALVFGLLTAVSAVAILAVVANVEAAGLLAFTIFFYAVVYTIWLKRRTPQNIVIGGAAGALAPVIGWTAVTGGIAIEPIVLFLIIFLWTPPHFWALAINRSDEYARAGVPMLPVVSGRTITKRWILFYSGLLFPISLLPWIFGFAHIVYGVAAGSLSAAMVILAVRLLFLPANDGATAHRFFGFSIIYLFAIFALLVVD